MAQPARKPAPREQPREPMVVYEHGDSREHHRQALEKVADILLEILLTSDSDRVE
jgi:hypothetical protein